MKFALQKDQSLCVWKPQLKAGKSESEAWTEHLGENPYNKGDGG